MKSSISIFFLLACFVINSSLADEKGFELNLFKTNEWAVSTEPIGRKENKPIVGAIRWDAWHGKKDGVNDIVEKTLAPKEFHDRLPFFAKILSDDSVRIDGSSQEIMDKEIAYAKYGGVDYWAFVTYQEKDMLSLGLKSYLKSKHRSDINFCAITEQDRFNIQDTAYINYVIRLIKEPGYQTVLDNRPLWYFGFINPDNVNKTWGSFHNLKLRLDSVRNVIIKAGLKNPYIVIMDFDALKGKKWCDSLGCDAISSYVALKHTKLGTYKQLAQEVSEFWDECKATGEQVVPIWVSGWNPKPRIIHQTPWYVYPKEEYYSNATPEELRQHFKAGLEWLKNNKQAAKAQCAIIYAWNEFDEGGWLCPTINNNSSRLEALKKVLANR